MESNKKKGGNPLLNKIIAAGIEKEQALAPTLVIQPEREVSQMAEPIAENLPEKKVEDPVIEEKGQPDKGLKLSEKNEGKKAEYSLILRKREGKESIEKTNIFTPHRDMLKRISTAEGISIQDLLGNIIDEFGNKYKDEIKSSLRKLLM